MTTIEAAGGVLWRRADTRLGVEMALVHRPGRSAWSLPKGVLVPGEHAILGALREVWEETGHHARVGPALGEIRYLRNDKPKRVRYWSLAAGAGEFTANSEIDDLIWLPPDAAGKVARRRDKTIIDRFWRLRPDRSRPLLLVRPGSLKSHWTGSAAERPLGGRGRRQAADLAQFLTAFDIRHAVVADLRRCTEMLVPFTAREPLGHRAILSLGDRGEPSPATADRLSVLPDEDVPTVVCAEQDVLARLTQQVSTKRRPVAYPQLTRGSVYVMHLDASTRRHIVASEHVRPVV